MKAALLSAKYASKMVTPRANWAACALLITASSLKARQLTTSPLDDGAGLSSRSLVVALVLFEMLLAFWLAIGIGNRIARMVAIETFCLFAVVSVIGAVRGAESCGCFGRLSIRPIHALIIDLVVVVGLWRWRPVAQAPRFFWLRCGVAAVCYAGFVVPTVLAIGRFSPDHLLPDGQILGSAGVVVLEPREWVGQRFALADYIDIDADMKKGDWIAIFHRHDCPLCSHAMPAIKQWAALGKDSGRHSRVALIEVPPLARGTLAVTAGQWWSSGKLSAAGHRWLIRTPIAVRINDGKVLSVEGIQSLIREGPP